MEPVVFCEHTMKVSSKPIKLTCTNIIINNKRNHKFTIESVTPGVGLEPTSPEGHQLACHYLISRLTPFRVYNLPSLGTPALFLTKYCNLMVFSFIYN